MSESDEDIYALVSRPLYACVILVVLFFLLIVFGSVSTGGAAAGLINPSSTLADYSPIFGVGTAIVMLMLIFITSASFSRLYDAFMEGKFDNLFGD